MTTRKFFSTILQLLITGMITLAFPAVANERDAPSVTSGNSALATRLDEALQAFVNHQRFSGSVLLARGDEILLHRTYGWMDWAKQDAPLTVATRFNIGSIGKLLTQTLVLERVEEGQWSLDDTLAELWPDSGIPEADAITLEHLLSHQSGLAPYMTHPDFSLEQRTLGDMLDLIRTGEREFAAPGDGMAYSNSAYWVLAALLERHDRAGRSWQDLFREEIFEPAAITNARFLQPDGSYADRPRGYWFSAVGERQDRTGAEYRPGPDGGIYMTAADLWRFYLALRSGHWHSAAMLEESTRKRAPFLIPGCIVGLSWEVCDLEGVRLVTKGGTTASSGSEFVTFTHQGDDYLLVMLSNFSNAPLMIYQEALRYALELPNARLPGPRHTEVIHAAVEAGELKAMKEDYPAWAALKGLQADPMPLYVLGHHYIRSGLPKRGKALFEINVENFSGHPPSASYLKRLETGN